MIPDGYTKHMYVPKSTEKITIRTICYWTNVKNKTGTLLII